MKIRILITIFTVLCNYSYAQISNGGIPLGYHNSFENKDTTPTHSTKAQIRGKLIIEDICLDDTKNKTEECGTILYGKGIDVNVDFFDIAKRYEYNNDTTIWILNIKSQNAFGYQLVFNSFFLPKDCKLFIYNETKTMKIGAFTSRNIRPDNRFVTQNINGNSIYLELIVPSTIKKNITLNLENVVYIYNDIFSVTQAKDDQSCFRFTPCAEALGWEKQIKSVAQLLITDGTNWSTCTGTLINKEFNYMDYEKPYMISAAHCVNNMARNGEDVNLEDCIAVFRYESNECMYDTNTEGEGQSKSVVGFTEIENNSEVDFLLLQLNNQVGEIIDYDISFSGWDRRTSEDVITDNVFGIHHPMGKSKNISIDYQTPVSSYLPNCGGTQPIELNYLKLFFDFGNVHNGSSGSPLYNSSKLIIGTLHGTDCRIIPAPGPCDEKPVFYSKLSVAWEKCNLYEHLASTAATEYVQDYTPYTADINITHNLPVEISTSPTNISSTDPCFKVKATTSTIVSYPINWFLWINKNPEDLNNYRYGSSMCFSSEMQTNTDEEFESDCFNQFTEPGTYKAKLFVYDRSGKQSTTDFSINISESNDPCIYTFIWNNESARQNVFRKGSKIQLYDNCYVWDTQTYEVGSCNEIRLEGSNHFQPKYQGISRIKWKLNNNYVYDQAFNTTWYYQYATDVPSYPIYYNQHEHGFPTEIVLTKTGINKIKLEAYGGKMKVSNTATHFTHPFPYPQGSYHGPSSTTKTFIVVDCESVWDIYSPVQMFSTSGIEHSKGTINVIPNPSLTISSGESANWTAYNKIIINPGFIIENGASFIATAKKCPDLINGDKTINKSTFNNAFKNISSSEIYVYPNPAKEFIMIEGANHYDYEIFNYIGEKITYGQIFSNNYSIPTMKLKPGIYLLYLINSNSPDRITKKIIINEK